MHDLTPADRRLLHEWVRQEQSTLVRYNVSTSFAAREKHGEQLREAARERDERVAAAELSPDVVGELDALLDAEDDANLEEVA